MLINCNPESRKRVLSTFFDGVPAIADSLPVPVAPVDSSGQVVAAPVKLPAITERILHPPFRERACKKCHVSAFSNGLKEPMPLLCYNCHDDFREKFAFLHGPVAGGYCTQCHNPHQSANQKLLARKEDKLCFNCHQPADVYQNEEHDGIEPSECMDCHDPHGGQVWSFTE